MGSDIKRPEYSPFEASDVAQAANLIAAEARAAGRAVLRPFSGSTLEGRPEWTAAHSVMWWHEAERDALSARLTAAEAALDAAQAEHAEAVAAARAEGEAAGRAAERGAVVAHLRCTGWSSLIAEAAVIEDGEHVAGPTFACCGEGA